MENVFLGSILASWNLNLVTLFILITILKICTFICIFPEVALSPNNHEVHIYQRADSDWKLVDVLNQHDLRVTGIDWAPKTNRIVTCAVVSIAYQIYILFNSTSRKGFCKIVGAKIVIILVLYKHAFVHTYKISLLSVPALHWHRI